MARVPRSSDKKGKITANFSGVDGVLNALNGSDKAKRAYVFDHAAGEYRQYANSGSKRPVQMSTENIKLLLSYMWDRDLVSEIIREADNYYFQEAGKRHKKDVLAEAFLVPILDLQTFCVQKGLITSDFIGVLRDVKARGIHLQTMRMNNGATVLSPAWVKWARRALERIAQDASRKSFSRGQVAPGIDEVNKQLAECFSLNDAGNEAAARELLQSMLSGAIGMAANFGGDTEAAKNAICWAYKIGYDDILDAVETDSSPYDFLPEFVKTF